MTPFDKIKAKAYLLTIQETVGELLYALDNDKDFPMEQDIQSVESIIHASKQVKEIISK